MPKIKALGKEVNYRWTLTDKIADWRNPVEGLQRRQSRIKSALLGGYTGGSRSKRSLVNWFARGGDADADTLPDLPTLRARSSDLVRNNPIATSAVNTAVTNAVGSGLRMNSAIDREYLGLDDEKADQWEAHTEREFDLWASSKECDATRVQNFYDKQGQVFFGVLDRGDMFTLLKSFSRAGFPYSLKLDSIEADRVCNKDNTPDSPTLSGGIEIDNHSAPKAAHIARKHPGSRFAIKNEWDVIPFYGPKSGRLNIIHTYEQKRPGQRRGVPYLAPVIEALKQLGQYTDAELMASVVAGMFTVFIKSDSGADEPFDLVNDEEQSANKPDNLKLGNGSVVRLSSDEEIETANPGRPNQAFDPFVMAILRQIGAALEIPFELLVKHFTASYSASKAAFVEAWKFFNHRRTFLVRNFCQPVYSAWMDEAVRIGRITAPGYFTDPLTRKAYLGAHWTGPGKGQINELQEVNAAEKRINIGISTVQKESAEINGSDWEQNHRQRRKEHKMRKDDGLIEEKSNSAQPPPEKKQNADN